MKTWAATPAVGTLILERSGSCGLTMRTTLKDEPDVNLSHIVTNVFQQTLSRIGASRWDPPGVTHNGALCKLQLSKRLVFVSVHHSHSHSRSHSHSHTGSNFRSLHDARLRQLKAVLDHLKPAEHSNTLKEEEEEEEEKSHLPPGPFPSGPESEPISRSPQQR